MFISGHYFSKPKYFVNGFLSGFTCMLYLASEVLPMIFIPHSDKKRALLLVDIQAGFLNERNWWIIPNIQEVIKKGQYQIIIEIIFHAEVGSLWDKQTNWVFQLQPTIPDIKKMIKRNSIIITKSTKSAFKGDKDLVSILNNNNIEEVHIVGLDTNDCVFATAQESFDLGFSTFVLEECTESSEGAEYRFWALKILRGLGMTNRLL